MSITVVGSIAFDAVETPFGHRDRMLGGAATHFALAASLLDQVRIVGPVGDDFGDDELAVLRTRGTNIDDVERVAGGKTFFWKGKYGWDLNTRDTLDTQLNVFEHFEPKLSDGSRASDVLFLANIQPGLQLQVREQCEAAKFVALDSMNLWIDIARDELMAIIGKIDCLVLNDEELRQLTGKPNLISASHEVLGWGPSMVVAKQGEYGSALITKDDFFALPAYPLHTVVDPTGAGGPCNITVARHRRPVRRLHRQPDRPSAHRRDPAQRDGLRHGAGLVQRRAVRHRGPGGRAGARRARAGRRSRPLRPL